MKGKIKVLIVDSSSSFRETLSRTLSLDASIEVMGTAPDPFIAAGKMAIQAPDVITTDIEMARMDGLTFLKKIMSQHPVPVIIISNLVGTHKQVAAKAYDYGAVEVITKQLFEGVEISIEARIKICHLIKKAAASTLRKKPSGDMVAIPKFSADAVLPKLRRTSAHLATEKVIVLGASTGGTEAIKVFLEALPADAPGVLIVQHMPANFTRSFAKRLNELCKIEVREAINGDVVRKGLALIAPGNQHVLLKNKGAVYYVEVNDGPLVNRHRPSVDVLFRSAAIYAGRNSIGILLTGMGADGAKGLLEMKESGARTIAQDEKSCVVFGMPKEAILLNAANKVLPLSDIAGYVMQNVPAG
jgi:two-component system chemotaxis response regulator CheB